MDGRRRRHCPRYRHRQSDQVGLRLVEGLSSLTSLGWERGTRTWPHCHDDPRTRAEPKDVPTRGAIERAMFVAAILLIEATWGPGLASSKTGVSEGGGQCLRSQRYRGSFVDLKEQAIVFAPLSPTPVCHPLNGQTDCSWWEGGR